MQVSHTKSTIYIRVFVEREQYRQTSWFIKRNGLIKSIVLKTSALMNRMFKQVILHCFIDHENDDICHLKFQ